MSLEYVDLIESFLKSELNVGFDVEALGACASLSKDQLIFFEEQLSAVDKAQHTYMTQVEPRRAIAQGEHSPRGAWVGDDDIRPVSAMFTHPYNSLAPIAIDHIKRQLLFFSRIAIRVPELRYGSGLVEKRENFIEFLRALLELKSLIEDGSIVLLPRYGFYSDEIEGGAGLVRIACTEDATLQKWIASHSSMLEDFALNARKRDPFFDAGIRICSAITYGHTLAATHPFVGYLHKLLLSDKERVDRGKIATIQNIEKIDLPGLGKLSWDDVHAVRSSEDSLQKWRADLAVAMSSVDPNLSPEEFIERFDSQVQAQLQRAALELDGNLKQSSSMARFKSGATNLVISAIAATAKITLGGPLAIWGAVKDVAQSDGAKEAVRFIWESREASAKKALRSHYAVFSSTHE